MKKMVLILLYAAGIVLAVAYGLILGNSTQLTTYESDLAGCTNICEPNGGLDRIWTEVYCTCENGALFNDNDVRK